MRRALLLSAFALWLISGLSYAQGPQSVPSVPTLAALKALPTSQFKTPVQRQGFLTPGDGGSATYTPSVSACPLNTGAGDNGSQVQPTTGGGCWIAELPTVGLNAEVWGAKGDGTTNDSTAINAAIAAIQSVKGGVILLTPGKTYAIANTLTISNNGVKIKGNAGGTNHHVITPPLSAPILKWTGATGSTAITILAPFGSVSNGVLQGVGIEGVIIDGNNIATTDGLLIRSLSNGAFTDLRIRNFTGTSLDLNVIPVIGSAGVNTNFGEPCDSQFNTFTRLSIDGPNGTVGLRLGSRLNAGAQNSGCNASFNTFYNTDIIMGGAATDILLDGVDNNRFYNTRTTGYGLYSGRVIDFSIHSEAGLLFASVGNTFHGLTTPSAGATGVISRGTPSFGTCTPWAGGAGLGTCTGGNSVFDLDRGNSSAIPTIEAGSQLFVHTSFGSINGEYTSIGTPTLGTCTGNGSTGSCAFNSGNSHDSHGLIALTVSGSGPGVVGFIPITFSPGLVHPNFLQCTVMPINGSAVWPTAVWDSAAQSGNTLTLRWTLTNSAVAIPVGSYQIFYRCWGW